MDKVLKLGGHSFRCIPRLPPGMLFDLAEAMDSGSEIKAIAQMSRTIKAIVVKEDQEKLRTVLNDPENDVDFATLNESLGTLIAQYSGRPFGGRSDSARGPGSTGGTSKVVSLSRGTVREDAASSTDGKSIAS